MTKLPESVNAVAQQTLIEGLGKLGGAANSISLLQAALNLAEILYGLTVRPHANCLNAHNCLPRS